METRRRETEDNRTRLNLLPVDDVFAFHDTHDRTGDIVVTRTVEARHFSSFATDQNEVVFAASLSHTSNELVHDTRFQAARSHVVEEEQRTCALNEDIVTAVVHDVLARQFVRAHFDIDLELGAHAVNGAHEDRVLHAEVVQREQATEVAHVAENALVESGTYGLLDTDHCLIGTCQGNSCVCVIHLFSFALRAGSDLALFTGTLFFINISERIKDEACGIRHLVDVYNVGHHMRIQLEQCLVTPGKHLFECIRTCKLAALGTADSAVLESDKARFTGAFENDRSGNTALFHRLRKINKRKNLRRSQKRQAFEFIKRLVLCTETIRHHLVKVKQGAL